MQRGQAHSAVSSVAMAVDVVVVIDAAAVVVGADTS